MQKWPALKYLHDLGLVSREAFPQLYDQWVEVYDRMRKLRGDEFVPNMGHHDANIDLILRKCEDEQVGVLDEFGAFMDGGPLFLQIAFSRHWILSSYELLRTTVVHSHCDSNPKDQQYCCKADCFRCKLKDVKKEFSAVRMPLAKFEPANLLGKLDASSIKVNHLTPSGDTIAQAYPGHGRYHGEMLFDKDSGALGWSVSRGKSGEARILGRRELSDLFFQVIPTDLG